jgi:hypothetical protein
MSDAIDTMREKVRAIFAPLAQERANRLDGSRIAKEAMDAFGRALAHDHPFDVAHNIAFHLADWNSDAAFIVAVHLFPEKFTDEELAAGADMLLIHAPNRLAAAATLANHPIQDVFDVGVPHDPIDET